MSANLRTTHRCIQEPGRLALRIMKTLLPLALTILSACASAPAPQTVAQFRSTIPTCSGPEDCRAKWEAAQIWVSRNAGMKIQTVTDVLIETYNPTGGDPSLGVRVVKEPLGGGAYRLVVTLWCDNLFGCVPDPWQKALEFNRAVGAVKP